MYFNNMELLVHFRPPQSLLAQRLLPGHLKSYKLACRHLEGQPRTAHLHQVVDLRSLAMLHQNCDDTRPYTDIFVAAQANGAPLWAYSTSDISLPH